MVPEKSDTFQETANFLHQLTAEETIRQQCEARERYYRDVSSSIRIAKNQGLQEGVQKMSQLITLLVADNRMKDVARASSDEEYREQLFQEYHL